MIEEPIHTQVEDVHVHPKRTGARVVDLVLAISAITISIVSLFVALEHGRTERKLVESGSWPFIQMRRNLNAQGLSLVLENSGVGPAQLISLTAQLHGRQIRNLVDLLEECCGISRSDTPKYVRSEIKDSGEPRGVLAPRESFTLMSWNRSPTGQETFSRLFDAASHLQFTACYCSALDECWKSNMSGISRPKKVDTCVSSDNEFTVSD